MHLCIKRRRRALAFEVAFALYYIFHAFANEKNERTNERANP